MNLLEDVASPISTQVSKPGRLLRLSRWLRRTLGSEAPSDADPRAARLAWIVTAAATLWFVLAACWEMGGPLGSGHTASSAAMGLAGENTWKWKILGPITYVTASEPSPSSYYCNHPWGTFWTTALVVKIFGHHDFVCRLAPIVMSALTPPLLFGIGKRIWGPLPGALGAASFVVVPIALAFANFNALEVPVIFGSCLAIWGYLRMVETWRRRWLLVSAFGFFHAFNADWAAYFFGAPLLVFMLGRGILFNGRWYPPVDRRRFAQWWALAACIAVGLTLFYFFEFQRSGQLGNLLSQGIHRSAGSDQSLDSVLYARAHWIDLAFTPLAVLLGKVALPVMLLRLTVLRKDLEIFPLAILVMAVVQYVVFKQGADMHFFWPHYFAPYFALAMGCLGGSLEGLLRLIVKRFGRSGRFWPPVVAFATLFWVPISMIPDGVTGLVYARRTGGRYDERGDLSHQDIDKITVLKHLRQRVEPDSTVVFHEGMKVAWNVDWSIRRPVRVGAPPTTRALGDAQLYVADSRFIYAKDLSGIVEKWHVEAYGPFWVADRSRPKLPIDGFSLEEREPTRLEWTFRQAHDPIYSIVPDPFVTWELRTHFKQEPNPAPSAGPATFDQRRIAHNRALASGESALAQRLLAEIEAELDKSAATKYSDGTRLMGTRQTAGAAPKLWVCFQASGPIDSDAMFHINTEVIAARRWSWVGAPARIRAVGMPFALPTPLWKQGFVYCSVSEIRPRPGTEKWSGVWGARRGTTKLPVSSANGALLTTVW